MGKPTYVKKTEGKEAMQKPSMEQLKKVGKLAGKMISFLSILFVVYAIWKLGFDFQSIHNWTLFLAVAFASVVLKCGTVYVSGSAWAGWLAFFAGRKIDKREALCVYAKANIGKYLPGNVMHYVERNLFATNLDISQKKLAVSTILEVLGLVGVAFMLSVVVSAGQLAESFQLIFGDSYRKILCVVAAIALAIILAGCLFLRKRIAAVLMEYTWADFVKTLLFSLLQYTAVLVGLGVIMVALYAYMGGHVTWENASLIVSGYVVAWVLGFVIPGASGGIGVRELVITLLLGKIVGVEMVLTLSVIHRLITVIGDFLAYLVMLVLRRKNDEKNGG
ncbi:hypothetical protein AALC25_06505 [Lachnospiraceae bacterium 29-84]